MRVIADFHIHSKYARACSPLLTSNNLALWADKKGIGILGTGDFTHPKWMEELEGSLRESGQGLYMVRNLVYRVRFLFIAKTESVYRQGDQDLRCLTF